MKIGRFDAAATAEPLAAHPSGEPSSPLREMVQPPAMPVKAHRAGGKAAGSVRLQSLRPSPSRPGAEPAQQACEPEPAEVPQGLLAASAAAATGIAAAFGADGRPAREQYVEKLAQYGCTREQLETFEVLFGAQFIPSASAGRRLALLNDHVGILKIPAYDGPPDAPGGRSVVAEQFAVIRAEVPAQADDESAQERFFVKGYGDRLIDFRALEQAMTVHSPSIDTDAASSAARLAALDSLSNRMETPLRSEVKRLSHESELIARRDVKESDAPVMPLPPNDTKMAWRESWANHDAAMSPGAGPMLPNGTRKFQLDYNATENRLIIFRNDNGGAARKHSILSDGLGKETAKLASAWCEGPILAEIQGIRAWEDMGPATDHRGVKQGNTQRLLHRAKRALMGPREPDAEAGLAGLTAAVGAAKPGAHIRITTEDGSLHDLKVDDKGIKLWLVNPQASPAHRASGAAFGGPGKVQADVDVYSYQGRDTGVHGSRSGYAEPMLVTSSGEALAAGPLLKDHGPTLGQSALRLVTFQPLLAGQDRGLATVRLVNALLNTASKFLYIFATSAVNESLKGSDGVHLPGAQRINASGVGSAGNGQLALAAAGIVAAQEAVTLVMAGVARMVPEPWKRRPEGLAAKVVQQSVVPMAEEMVRLLINLGVQRGVGIARGGAFDYGTLAAASFGKGAIETWREHAGPDRANHPVANALLDTAQGVQYNALRALGIAGSADGGALGKTFAEALINRLVVRGCDQIAMPLVTQWLNAHGVIGPNAGAFEPQLSQAHRVEDLALKVSAAMKGMCSALDTQDLRRLRAEPGSVGATLHAGAQDLAVGVERYLFGSEFHSDGILVGERVKQILNRVHLALEQPTVALPAWMKSLSQQLGLMKQAIDNQLEQDPSIRENVQRAGHFSTLEPPAQLEHLRTNEDRFGARVSAARELMATEQAAAGRASSSTSAGQDLRESPITNSLDETASAAQRFVAKRVEALAAHVIRVDESADHRGFIARNSLLERPVPSATNVDYGLVMRPFGGGASARIPRQQTTFSTLPQAQAYGKNRRMATLAGIDSIVSGHRLPPAVLARIEMAVRNYTVESQFFHYPLRWQVTGELQHEEIAPGVQVAYNVMNRRGNTSGSRKERVDPIEALYINLGAQMADKFPAEMFRAVVTEAAYKARLDAGQSPGDAGLMTLGNKGVLTEILSATMSTPMAAGFNLPIANYGSAPRENSLRIVMNQESGVNIATWADLVQGEVIMMPGAVLQVEVVDATAGKGSHRDRQTMDIGQVVYLKAVDTYALELAHDRYAAYKQTGEPALKPADGALMIDPASGHFYKFDAAKDDSEAVSETKNYFTGRQLEAVNAAGRPATEEARWRKPYTSDGATRATKDAIHMSILRQDPIVPFLDLATENVHHAWFAKKAEMEGRFNRERAQAEDHRKEATRVQARGIAKQIQSMTIDTPLQAHGAASAEMLAWLMAGMLRRPMLLVPVDDATEPPRLSSGPKPTLISLTYDKVDLLHPRQSIGGRNPAPAMNIGMGQHGIYALRHEAGEFIPHGRFGEGKTVGKLLHAVMWAGYAKPSQYVESNGFLQPDARARSSVNGLLDKMKQLAQTEYFVLQEALTKKLDELGPRDPQAMSRPAAG